MRLIVIKLTGQKKKRATTNKEERTAQVVPRSRHYIPASSVVGESRSRVVSPLKNIRAQCLIG